MKEIFKVFYESSEEELAEIWSSSETIFILDTNILLKLYQYSQETQDEFFKILELIEDKIWIPFHVALEYQRRRLDVIRNEKSVFKDIDGKLTTIKKSVSNNLSEFGLKARNPDLFEMEQKFKDEVCLLIDSFKAEVDKAGKAQPSVRTHDEIRAKLDVLLEGKVGDEPEEKWVIDVAAEGDKRYENQVPPGYKDANKDSDGSESTFTHNNINYKRKFGDLIIWKQILEHLKNLDNIKNVIFITDDSKEDWWNIVKCDGNKHIGARTELKSEMYKETEVDSFKMYHSNDFLAAARNYCGVPINDKAIEETENLFKSWEVNELVTKSIGDTYLDILAHDELTSALANIERYKTEPDITAKWKDALANMEKHKSGSYNAANLLGALANIERYKTEPDITAKWKDALANMERYKTEVDITAKWKDALANMEKHKSEFDDSDRLNKLLNSLNNPNNLDDE